MKVMIAGGTGMIGTALADSLAADGHQITILTRDPGKVKKAYQSVSWEDEPLMDSLIEVDALINLVGESLAGSNPLQMRWTPQRKASLINSRVETGKKITRLLQQIDRKPEVLIQASAIGIYGNFGHEPVYDTSPPGDDFLASLSLKWEASTSSVEEICLRRVVIRIGLVLSRNGGLLPLLALPHRLFFGGPLGSGSQSMSWIHIDDVVASIKFLLSDSRIQGSYNLTSPSPVNNRTFSQTLGKALHRPSWFPIPGFALQLLLGEASTLALDGRPVYPDRLLEAGYQFQFPDLARALEDLLGK